MNGGSGGQHDNYGSTLTAQPGGSQGRPATNPSSQLIVQIGLPTLRAPDAPRPGWSHHSAVPKWTGRDDKGTATYMPDNGQAERMNRTVKDATVRRYHYASHDELRRHLALFLDAYNYARRLKTLKGLTPLRVHLPSLDQRA